MTTKYVFQLDNDDMKIIVNDETGPFNTWESSPKSNCLLVESGKVAIEDKGFVCRTNIAGYHVMLTLFGANWDSEVGATGTVEFNGSKCRSGNWELIEVL